jgi:hypothetical protein
MNRKAQLAIVLAITLTVQLAVAIGARGATRIGQLDEPFKYATCSGLVMAQTGVAPGTTAYTVPSRGVITGWQTATVTQAGSAKLKVLRATGTGKYLVVGEDGPRPVAANQAPAFSGLRIPVEAGDLVALLANTNCISSTANPADTYSFLPFGLDPAPGTAEAFFSGASGWTVELQATVEPDVDGDGYGDETQDGCPSDAAVHSTPCPAPGAGAGGEGVPAAALQLKVRGRRVQAALAQGGIVESVDSNQAAGLRASGSLRIAGTRPLSLRPASADVATGASARLVLRLTRSERRRLAAALRHGRAVGARIEVVGSAGTSSASVVREVAIKQASRRHH